MTRGYHRRGNGDAPPARQTEQDATGLRVAVAGSRNLQSELVFPGDEGTFEPRGATTRYGLDVEVRWRLLPWL
jgi:hypothetical protein